MSKSKVGKKLVVGAVEVKILKMLCEKGACIGEELVGDIRKGSVYVMLKRMRKKGWVSKDEDKRYKVLGMGLKAIEAWRVFHG